MRVIICGGRNYDDADAIRRALDGLHRQSAITVLIHGSLPALGGPAEAWARDHEVDVIRYPANWSKLGKLAETRRNSFMLADSRADVVLAFPGGRHTADLVRTARESGMGVVVIAPSERDAVIRHLSTDNDTGGSLADEPAEEDRWMPAGFIGQSRARRIHESPMGRVEACFPSQHSPPLERVRAPS